MDDGGDFARAMSDGAAATALDTSSARPTLLVAFGGLGGELGMPPFEFVRLAAALDTRKLFVRDRSRAWYHRGLDDGAVGVLRACARLRRLIAQAGASRVVMVGNSMGGFAALLFGTLLGVDEVHAFSPQTTIGFWPRLKLRDRRFRRELLPLHLGRSRRDDHRDLLPLLRQSARRCHVHFSLGDRLDRRHALRLRACLGVTLHAHRDGGHDLVRVLRDRGELARLLAAALRTTDQPR